MTPPPPSSVEPPRPSSVSLLVFAWLFVGLPLAWGITQTFLKALVLFH